MQTFTRGHYFLLIFSVLYVAGFGLYYLLNANYEFLWYVLIVVGAGLLLYRLARAGVFPLPVLWMLSIWGLLHMMGGGLRLGGGDVLYAHVLIPLIENGEFVILRYDQVVHAFGFGVATLAAHFAMLRFVRPAVMGVTYFLLLAMIGMGLGVVNELAEFGAVLALSETGVGGYYNLSLDLVFNTIGAALVAGYLFVRRNKNQQV